MKTTTTLMQNSIYVYNIHTYIHRVVKSFTAYKTLDGKAFTSNVG